MKKVTMLIIASITAVLLLQTTTFAESLLNTVIHKESKVIGATVIDIQGEKLGEITNLTFDKETGDITHVILSQESITTNGEKLTSVPIDALRFINENKAQLNISKECTDYC